MKRVAARAGLYFGIVFAVGFVLGTLRVLVLVPRVGERMAELAEAPLMLAATWAGARLVVRRHPDASPGDQLASGLLALAVLLSVEFGVVLTLRGLSLREYFQSRDPVAGAVYGALLVAFALMPWLLARRSRLTRS